MMQKSMFLHSRSSSEVSSIGGQRSHPSFTLPTVNEPIPSVSSSSTSVNNDSLPIVNEPVLLPQSSSSSITDHHSHLDSHPQSSSNADSSNNASLMDIAVNHHIMDLALHQGSQFSHTPSESDLGSGE